MDNIHFVLDHGHLLRVLFAAALIVMFLIFGAIAAWVQSPRRRSSNPPSNAAQRALPRTEHA